MLTGLRALGSSHKNPAEPASTSPLAQGPIPYLAATILRSFTALTGNLAFGVLLPQVAGRMHHSTSFNPREYCEGVPHPAG